MVSNNLHDLISISQISGSKDEISFSGKFKKGINQKSNTIIKVLKLLRRNKLLKRQYFKISDVRISIDNNIVYKLYSHGVFQNDLNSIVEIKTSIKKDLDKLIEDFPFQKKRFSKYCNAVEKLISG